MTRTAAEIGHTAVGPRPLPPLGSTRDVPLPDVVESTLPQRPAGARRASAGHPDGRAAPAGAVRGDAPEHPAVAELLAETLLTGTATRDRVTIDDELAAVGADLGVTVDPERLMVSGSGLAAGLPDVLGVLADVLTAASHPDAEVARERDRLVERIMMARAQPRTIAREALQRKRFGTTRSRARCRRRPRSPPSPPTRCGRCNAPRWCRGGRSSRSWATSIRPPRSRMSRSCWRAGRRTTPRASSHPRRRSSRTTWSWCTAPARCSRSCGSPRRGVGRADPDYTALQLANLVFGGYFSSRWMENIREDKGYTYGAHSGVEFVPGGGVLGVETDVASDVTAAALLETRYELGRLAVVPPTPAEVDAARAYAIGSLADLPGQPGRPGLVHRHAGRRRPHPRLARRPPRAARRPSRWSRSPTAALRYFAPTAVTGVIVGDADVIGPGVRALGGVA